MILNNTPANEAILSNVGATTEFRIKASAKAFGILSSGLYQNKIRAIVRELSCNAVDSHVAAGKRDTPFDIHLPTQMEPWYSIRDYGTGLSHEQVTNIYTTYFESSKADSNDYIGALGLGSKTPFSYTDNFTVTAVKDGRRGIYTAFITDIGLPSIALMMEEESTEPNGVEVKFSVNGYSDFERFKTESRNVYTYFALRPIVSGAKIDFADATYSEKDIVPGVHYTSGSRSSIAVMGNIGYHIQVPASDTTLGSLSGLLNCGLEIHFNIGELDFQASREGLSYIPLTVNSIKTKLEALNAQLAVHIAKEADKIKNLWERAAYLSKKKEESLFSAAVIKYVVDTKSPLMKVDAHQTVRLQEFTFTEDELAKKFNMVIKAFRRASYQLATVSLSGGYEYSKDAAGKDVRTHNWTLAPLLNHFLVVNDGKTGSLSRAKYHWRNKEATGGASFNDTVYVIEKFDKKQAVKLAEFLKAIKSPPANQVLKASDLIVKPRAVGASAKDVTILLMTRKDDRRHNNDYVWRDAGKADKFDAKKTFFYMPLAGYKMTSKLASSKELHDALTNSGIAALRGIDVYGVRKNDLDFIKTQKNWINLEDHIESTLAKVDQKNVLGMVVNVLDNFSIIRYNESITNKISDKSGLFLTLVSKFKGVERIQYSEYALNYLVQRYAPKANFKIAEEGKTAKHELHEVLKRYPLMKSINGDADGAAIAQYINLVDASLKQVEEVTQG